MELHNINGVLSHYLRRMSELYQGNSPPGINDYCSVLIDLLYSSLEFLPGDFSKENVKIELNQKFLPGVSRCFTGAVFTKSAPPGRRGPSIHMPCIRIWDGKAKVYGYIDALAPGKTKKSMDFYLLKDFYKQLFPNLILTDFLEFRYYRESRKVCTARPFNVSAIGKITNKTRVTNPNLFLKELEHFMGYCPKKSKDLTLIDLQQGLALKTFYLREFVLTPLMNHLHKSGSKCELVRLYRAYCYFFDLDLTFKEFSEFLTHVIIDGLLRAVIFYRSIDTKEEASQNYRGKVVEFAKFIGMDERRVTLFQFLSPGNSQLPAVLKWMLDDISWYLCGFDFKQIGFTNNNPWLLEGEMLQCEEYFFKLYYENEDYKGVLALLQKAGVFSGDKG